MFYLDQLHLCQFRYEKFHMLGSAYCAFNTTRSRWWNLSLKFRRKIYKSPYTGAVSPDSSSSDPIILNIHESNLETDLCKHTVKMYFRVCKANVVHVDAMKGSRHIAPFDSNKSANKMQQFYKSIT